MIFSKKILKRWSHGQLYGSLNLPTVIFRIWERHGYNYVGCTLDEGSHEVTLHPRREA